MKKLITIFLVLIFANPILCQNEPNDCVNALVVCGNGTFSSNADGIGDTQEVAGCYSSEHNSLWIKINIVQSGTLGFDLIPNDPSLDVDYDFWVYGPNKTCGNLGSPIRCCTTNPVAAGLTSNYTGLNNTLATTSGNGSDGNGYVFRLSVLAGQFYYIAVDRPHGDGGFKIEWNGTATNGTGAFPTPPTANQIPDLSTCSVTPNVGIFPLGTVRSQINSDLVNNTVDFYATLANATDGTSPLPDIYGNDPNSNPQRIYAKVVNNVSGCYTIIDFNLRVYPVPSANISLSKTQVCSGENVTATFTGTPGATVEYKVNGGGVQRVLLDANGTFQLVQSITVNTTYALVKALILDSNNATVCSQSENDVASVTVSTISAPTVTTNSPICEGDTAVLNFSGLANAVITYAINGGTAQTVTLDGTGNQQVSLTGLPGGSNVITLSNIKDSNPPNCSLDFIISETIIVNPKVTAVISGTTNVCQNASSPIITFTGSNGTAPYTFIYTINGGTNQTITTTSGNSVTIAPSTSVVGTFTYQLVSAASAAAPACVFSQIGNAVVTVNAIPTINGQLSACQNGTTQLTGTGSPAISNAWVSSNTTVATVNATGLVTGVGVGTSVITYTDSNGCFNTATITINPNVTPTFTQVSPICSGESLSALPTTSNNGITGTWSPALNNMATTTYTFTPTTGLCATTASMEIIVGSVTPTFTQVAPICSGGTLSALPTTSNNGITGTWSPALNNTATTIYTFTPTIGQCAVPVSMEIKVNSNVTPTFTQVPAICSGGTLSALPTTSNNGITGTWSPALNNTTTTIYTFTPTIGQCAISTTMEIGVTSKPIVTVINNTPSICSGGQVDITLNCNNVPNATIYWEFLLPTATGGSTGSGIGPIHLSDLITLSNGILVPTTVSLIVYAESSCRGDATQIDITINPLPTPVIAGGSICMDSNNNIVSNYTLNTGLSNANHTFIWYHNGAVIPGATTSTYTVDQANEVGLYEVEATNTITTCHSIRFQAVVDLSQPAQQATYVVSNYFEENQTITINVVGTGDYLYSLDGGEFQTSNVFSHVSSGEHSVTVHDSKGCTDITINHIFTIGYPHYFTPNGDGYHDTWNIWSLNNQPNSIIHIFDRLGKLIKQIRPVEAGWDGTFNGAELPSTDYWFSIQYNENQVEKVFKSHFSLKR